MEAGTTMPPIAAGDRQRRLARGRQFAGKRLAFDLQPDKEKEDGHQPVVDPLMNGERQRMPAPGNGDRRRQQAVVSISPRQNLATTSAAHAQATSNAPLRPLPFERIPERDSLSGTPEARPSSSHCATPLWTQLSSRLTSRTAFRRAHRLLTSHT